MKIKLTMTALLMATVSPIAMSQEQGLIPEAIPGGDQFEVNCLALIPGGDQFQNAIRQIDDELPEGIPGGDQLDRNAIPGGDQFEPYQIPGGDQFARSCFEGFKQVGLLIPGGDQFDPQALERLALGELELAPSLIERSLKMDRSSVQQIANGGGLGFDGFIRPNPNLSSLIDDDLIPGGDQFDPSAPALDPLKIDDELPEGIIGIDGFSKEDAEDLKVAAADLPDELGPISYGPEIGVVPVPVTAGCDWTGTWGSTYGILRLIQDGNQVAGDYSSKGFIKGTVGPGCNLKGTFDNRQEQIKGTYEFTRDGDRFEGLWGLDGELPYERWKGRRSSSELPVLRAEERWTAACQWTGTWFTPTTGVRMRLVQDGARVTGEIGDNLIVEGNTDTACEGRRDIRMEAAVTDRETGADQSMVITMSSGGQRYTGSLGGAPQGQAISGVFAGSRASRQIPALTSESTLPREQISDAGGEAIRATQTPSQDPPLTPVPRASTTLRWEVSLGSLCLGAQPFRKDSPTVAFRGIVWSKARVYDKVNGKEIELAPIGGFPNIKGDKERVWEIELNGTPGLYAVLAHQSCRNFNSSGLTGSAPKTLTYEIDYAALGYASEQEFLNRRRNGVRVMYKLYTRESSLWRSADVVKEELGTKVKTTAFQDANICGTCNREAWLNNPRMAPTGDGVFSGFRSDEDWSAFVLYDIQSRPSGS